MLVFPPIPGNIILKLNNSLNIKNKHYLLFALIIFLPVTIVSLKSCQATSRFSARCVKVYNGECIIARIDGHWFQNRIKLRLYKVQCPDRETISGQKARHYVKSMIYGQIIDVQVIRRRFWGWSEAMIYFNNICLNEAMIEKNWGP